jgi:hypothetical protein
MADFLWGDGGAQLTPEAISAQRKIAQAMISRGVDASPIQSWTQGAARVAEGLMGAVDSRRADASERQNAVAEKELLASLIGGGTAPVAAVAPVTDPVAASAVVAPAGTDQATYPAPVAPAAAPPTTFRPGITVPTGDAASAIASIESGGKYDLLGPVTKTGDRAYGKYQVMGANVPEWTKAHLGQAMTPEQFLASPEAQDAVFKGQFGQYAQKYGPGGAAEAWFAGEKGMTNPNAKDQLGTSVQSYADRFSKAYGGLPYQVAGPATAAPAAVAPATSAAPPVAAPSAPAVSPGVQTVAAAAPSVNPKLLTAMASPYVSDGTKKVLGIMLQSQLSSEGVTPIDAGNKIILTDKRGNVVRELPKGEPNKGPEYGVIGKDQFGNEQYGWRDPRTQSVTPGPQGATAAQPTIAGPDGQPMAIPQGQDPKVYREAASKAGVANALPANFDDTSKLRTEISQLPSYKNIAQAAPIYRSMADAAGRNTKAADLNMVYGLGKIMDPGSVVREGEIQMANNAQGWQEKLNGIIAQINGQGGLTPEGRQALMAEAHSRMQSYKMMYDQDAQRYRGIAQRNRANPEDVVADFGTFDPWTVPKGAPVEIDGYKIKAK